MKRGNGKKYILLLALTAIILQGCGKTPDNKNTNETTDEISTTIADDDLKDNNDIRVQLDFIDLDNYSLEYNPKEDAPQNYYWGEMSYSENGYFFISDYYLYTYWDVSSKIYLPLCSRPDCTHDDGDCVAFVNKSSNKISGSSIFYYKGYLYNIVFDVESGYVSLYRIKEDGTEYEKYVDLYKFETSKSGQFEICCPELRIHRDSIYYIIPNEKELNIYRLKMGETKSESIFKMSGERQDLYRMNVYGDYLFFQAGNFKDDKMLDIDGGIYAINVNTGKVYEVLKDAINTYGIYKNKLIYKSNDTIRQFDMLSKEDSVLIEKLDDRDAFLCGDDELLVFNNKKLYLYNYESKEKKDIDLPDSESFSILDYCNGIIFSKNNKGIYAYQNGWEKIQISN